jgi:hypothetical protein
MSPVKVETVLPGVGSIVNTGKRRLARSIFTAESKLFRSRNFVSAVVQLAAENLVRADTSSSAASTALLSKCPINS